MLLELLSLYLELLAFLFCLKLRSSYVDHNNNFISISDAVTEVTCLFVFAPFTTAQFMEQMLSRYGDQAREAGVYIVHCCGFDCIPNDLGALVLRRAFNG